VPGVLEDTLMWTKKNGEDVLTSVGVWVVCCGIQADGPMRQVLNRSLGPAAERGCDVCGILAKKGDWNATKYLGCAVSLQCIAWNCASGSRRMQASTADSRCNRS
jgi:hypothetical protein